MNETTVYAGALASPQVIAMKTEYDIIVVGAGVAGSAVAITLARQGREVLLLERTLKEPDRIVGELLQPGGVAALKELGLSECLEDIDAIPVRGYHIYWKTEEVTFWYPPWQKESQSRRDDSSLSTKKECSAQRAQGRSFHHGRFVARLRSAAHREEHVTMIESAVTGLVHNEHSVVVGVECRNGEKQTQTYHAPLTIIADGSGSNLRSHIRTGKPQAKSRFWGLELTSVDLPIPEVAYGIIGRGPPVLVYQIGTNETRILIDIPEAVHESIAVKGDVNTYIKETVLPTLPRAIQPKLQLALDTGRLRSMPNQWLPPQTNTAAGIVMLGDASNMRHPLTGGGMTVALNDVALLSRLLHPDLTDCRDSDAVLAKLRTFHWKRKSYSSALNILAQALYTLFVATDPQLEVMQRGFVRYIQRGGNCVEEPAGLMGGVYSNPFLLFYHFFAIALYSMWLHLCESPLLRLPVTVVACARVFVKAVSMILPFILSELWS